MSRGALGAVWYRFVVTWRRQRGGLIALVLIVGLAGGLSLGSIAAARRTAASFTNFMASTNPSDVTIVPAGGLHGYSASLLTKIRQIPHVEGVESYVGLQASLVRSDRIETRTLDSSVLFVGSVNGLLFNQDRFSVTSGRMADPSRRDEVVVSQTAAAVLGLRLGQTLHVAFASSSTGAEQRVRLHIVGIGLLNREVVADDISRFPTYIVATPALTRALLGDVAISYYGVQVRGGDRFVPAVERRFTATTHYFTDFELASQTEAEAEQSIRPEALALAVFGGIAGLAALVLAMQAIARLLSGRDGDGLVLRALGADPTTTTLDGLIGLGGSIVAGSVLAVGVAFGLSPLAPLGPARPVDPDRGFAADWTVLGLGLVVLVVVLGASAALLAFAGAPHRSERRRFVARRSTMAKFVARSALPVWAVAGTQFALERGRGRGRTAESSRWALLGTVTAMVVVAATLTFGSSLQTLVSQPRLYGWNWNCAVQSSDGYGPVPNGAVATAVAHDPAIAATSGVWFATLQLNGIEVPVLLGHPGAPVAPPVVAGHGLQGTNQVVLGSATLAQLHEHIGGTVGLRYTPKFPRHPIALRIVGVATMPAIGIAESLHTSMAIGAVVPDDNGMLTKMLGPNAYPGCNGPNMLFVRVRGGVGTRTGLAAAQRIVTVANHVLSTEPQDSTSNCGGNKASLLSVQHPAQIANYRSMGTTPVLLAGGLALGAVFALGLALTASVRRRRRDLALLKTIGFTRRQLASAIAWQSSIAAVVGILVGLPLGVVLGRWLWNLFADEIGAVPAPTVPAGWLAMAGIAALVLANVVAAFPGRSAARTPTGVLLHEE